MKVLIATMPMDGHFNPLTGVAKHLQDQGHDVRWYAGASYDTRLRELGIPRLPFDRAVEVNSDTIAELFPERAKLKGPRLIAFDAEQLFFGNVENHYRDIADIREHFTFDAFFCDGMFCAGKLVAEKTGVAGYVVNPAPLFARSRDVPPPGFGLKPAQSLAGRLTHRAVRAVLFLAMRKAIGRFNGYLDNQGLEPISVNAWMDVPHLCATHLFQVGIAEMDFPRTDLPPNVTFVGALLPYRRVSDDPFPLAERLRDESVIVVSQGTVDNHDLEKLIVPALEALKDGSHTVVVATGGTRTAELRQRFPQSNVIIEDFVDFDALFDYADVFVCNGGYGSIVLAMSHGVPVVAAGIREGKNDINARLAYLGLGLDLRTERPSPKKIAAAVDRIIGDATIAANVARIAKELATYDALRIIDDHIGK
ncbi:glycosyltransferase [Antrihabitans cavernicola]|uniref:Glycosyltransferase n=1 Tax=Antrihabitans cavernicola TaxID=2495913 RepID=A0A5A7SHN1_9NOCA|nr:nucleotide disphospho-sugar-binding domain-containing protein [Spelaeibacter cavernicola]KAA0024672.1 glycosyltransferase [Spelaeibacter cavernicola]